MRKNVRQLPLKTKKTKSSDSGSEKRSTGESSGAFKPAPRPKGGGWLPAPGEKDKPVICVTDQCNQRCVFCSRVGMQLSYPPERIRSIISTFKDCVCFEGGEPTLDLSVLKWIALAKSSGVRDRILVTNGTGLEDPGFALKFISAGVTLFNVNLPAHAPRLFDRLTGTKGKFGARLAAVRNLIKLAGGDRVRVTLVLTSAIVPELAAYARFVVKELPGLFYLEINMVRPVGRAASAPGLVPRFAAASPRLAAAFKILDKGGMKFMVDGFPLCRLKGFEHRSIDAMNLASGKRVFSMAEKRHFPPCAGCSLLPLCPGLSPEYAELRGYSELSPSRVRPAAVKALLTGGPGRKPA